jgi:hypothetical protein
MPEAAKSGTSLLKISNRAVMISHLEWLPGENSILLRLYNCGEKVEQVTIEWPSVTINSIYLSNLLGEKIKKIGQRVAVSPFGYITLKLESRSF